MPRGLAICQHAGGHYLHQAKKLLVVDRVDRCPPEQPSSPAAIWRPLLSLHASVARRLSAGSTGCSRNDSAARRRKSRHRVIAELRSTPASVIADIWDRRRPLLIRRAIALMPGVRIVAALDARA